MSKSDNSFRFIYLLVLAMTLWGFSWSSGKVMSPYVSRETIVFWRFLLTFVSIVPVSLLSGESLRTGFRGFLILAAASAFYTAYNILFFMGLEKGMAGQGGVLVTTLNPVITFIIVMVFSFHRVSVSQAAGLIIGLLGGAVLLEVWSPDFSDHIFTSGNIYFLLASFTWAMVSIFARWSSEYSSSAAYSLYVYGLSFLFIIPFTSGEDLGRVFEFDYLFWMNLVYISLISTSFGTTVFFYASAKLGSEKASSFIFLVPVTALLGSWIFLGEMPSWTIIAGGTAAITAVYLINGAFPVINKEKKVDNKQA